MNASEAINILNAMKEKRKLFEYKSDIATLEIQALDEAIDILKVFNQFAPTDPPKSLDRIYMEQKIRKACKRQWLGVPYKPEVEK